MLDNPFAESDLTVSRHDHLAVAANRKDCGGTNQTLGKHERQTLIIAASPPVRWARAGSRPHLNRARFYAKAIRGTASSAARMPTVFQRVKFSCRTTRASRTVTTG